ncbi:MULTISPECIES: APC family permease [unclassified Pseudomonas]|uniref:APC family permease n=1 Tax=unclassified Pseudomonas TaxID=196821 RepID=UPI000BA47E9B|nr:MULTISPECIES: APC family permease [unclassified Pseudomonas]MCU1724548.1 APC family permease [Pseudomonas sp. 5P_5.1_Bac1]MCU1735663.1 APC family permease [Pseudomonas sp. 20P_3.2_Bac4]MCU1747230.1 APC family permease [Pseudomonas sp. 20P_3.2_Bac5]
MSDFQASLTPSTAGQARASAGTSGASKGLAKGRLGLLASIVLGISTIAPVYTLTGALGPTVREVGAHLPAVFIVGFLPMLLVALGYRELNAAEPDSGTSFTWSARAFGPMIGWIGGWGLVTATTIVLSNLAGVAVDFFYLFLGQLTGSHEVAALSDNLLINVITCCVFIAMAVWICCRGIGTTMAVQYGLVALQLLVLIGFAIAAFGGSTPEQPPMNFQMDWFNPFGVESFSAFTAGLSLSIFIFWGWDVCLTMSEESVGSDEVPGRAATLTVLLILGLYLVTAIATLQFAGISEVGLGLGNPRIQENVFAHLAGPVMGPLAILMSIAVLASTAASLQSTFVSPARTLLAMGYYGAVPERFARICPRSQTPRYATICAGIAAGVFYVTMRTLSENVLADTITALGMMICFYYSLTAFACVWYFRHSLMDSARHFMMRGVCPLLGGGILSVIFVQTAIDSASPSFGSGSHVGGLGLVFVIAMIILLLGIVLMLLSRLRAPAFFLGMTLRRHATIPSRR